MSLEITFEHSVNESVGAFETGGLVYVVLFTRTGDDDSWAVTFSRQPLNPFRRLFQARRWVYAPTGDRQPFAALGGVAQVIQRFIAEKKPAMIGFKSANPKLVYAYNRWVQRPAIRRAMQSNAYFFDVSDTLVDGNLFRQFLFTSERYMRDLIRQRAFENANCLSEQELFEKARVIIEEKFNTVPDYTPPDSARSTSVNARVHRVVEPKKKLNLRRILPL
jgi:hypothetical protein